MIDSLDLLWLIKDDVAFNRVVEWIEQEFDPNRDVSVNMFEVTIRVLGGILSGIYTLLYTSIHPCSLSLIFYSLITQYVNPLSLHRPIFTYTHTHLPVLSTHYYFICTEYTHNIQHSTHLSNTPIFPISPSCLYPLFRLFHVREWDVIDSSSLIR